ncbi:hypothetical protein [Gillisia hiemivivida]|uniref:DUF4149 domain-containing protein n=1 Tax=Gillisia hiemivivida TaxID=291190 RepID=A0A5C6ZVP9_9FLAO|nr:hypothetical protein [Gillisia hiemivivida]TXD94769.1 hypothetical protein ES724_04655 [Gillisia hiemivivida]
MTAIVKYPVALASVFLWLGFVGAISFMEAWLKFRAPGVTLSLGLGIGRLVFDALNKVEWVLAFAVLANLIFAKARFFSLKNLFYFIPLLLLIFQSIWVLPALDARAELIIQGQELASSYLHFYYVGMEIVKVVCLFVFGIKLLDLKNIRRKR